MGLFEKYAVKLMMRKAKYKAAMNREKCSVVNLDKAERNGYKTWHAAKRRRAKRDALQDGRR
jgi:uncharacterized protein (UPF0248 family)